MPRAAPIAAAILLLLAAVSPALEIAPPRPEDIKALTDRFERMVKAAESYTAGPATKPYVPPDGRTAADILAELRKLKEKIAEGRPAEDRAAALARFAELRCPASAEYLWESYGKAWAGDFRRELLSTVAAVGEPDQAMALAAESVRGYPRRNRMHAAKCAAECDETRACAMLESVAASPGRFAASQRWCAVEALYAIGTPRAREPILKALDDPDPDVAGAAAEALALLRHAEAVPAMARRLKNAPADLRADLADALADLTGQAFKADAVRWEDWWAKEGPAFRAPEPRVRKASSLYQAQTGSSSDAPDDPYAWDIGDCPMDLVLLYDTTGSLAHKWPYLSTAVDSLLRELQRRAPSLRVGAVRYRATDKSLTYRIAPFPMTRNLEKIRESVKDAMFGGGSGGLNLGLGHALMSMRWRLKARRVVWVLGDMSPDAAGGGMQSASYWVANAAREDKFLVATLYIETLHGELHRPTYRSLAQLGNGRFYEYDEAERHWVDWTTGKADRKAQELPQALAEKLLTPRPPATATEPSPNR